jgi:hypothetical protein
MLFRRLAKQLLDQKMQARINTDFWAALLLIRVHPWLVF